MIDLDGLKLIDPSQVKLGADGEVEGAPALMAHLKKAKALAFRKRFTVEHLDATARSGVAAEDGD